MVCSFWMWSHQARDKSYIQVVAPITCPVVEGLWLLLAFMPGRWRGRNVCSLLTRNPEQRRAFVVAKDGGFLHRAGQRHFEQQSSILDKNMLHVAVRLHFIWKQGKSVANCVLFLHSWRGCIIRSAPLVGTWLACFLAPSEGQMLRGGCWCLRLYGSVSLMKQKCNNGSAHCSPRRSI